MRPDTTIHLKWIQCFVIAVGLSVLAPAAFAADDHADLPEGPIVANPYAGPYPIRVVATTGMVGDLARNVGGEHVAVHALMGEGVDPHLYKATPGDVRSLRGADLILFNGLHLEGKMADILLKLARLQPTFAVTEGLDRKRLREPPEFQGNYDPHVWFDVAIWSDCALFVRDVLIALDPPHADDYRRNADDYRRRLDELHIYARAQLATVPRERRVLVTAHDAFGYFGRAYDVEVLAIQGISTESEAGVHKVNELVGTIADRGVLAVFVETSVSDKNIKALVEGCQSRGHALRIGGSLYSDAMGADGTPEGAYPGMVRRNVDTIVGALK
jgi:manganese/zinc/iron transport system substrate-binding protein